MKRALSFLLLLAAANAEALVRCDGSFAPTLLDVKSGEEVVLPVTARAGALDYDIDRVITWSLLPAPQTYAPRGTVASRVVRPATGATPDIRETFFNASAIQSSVYVMVSATNHFSSEFVPCTEDFLVTVAADPGLVRDSSRLVVPVVGTVRGANDSFFRTSLKLENLWSETISGTITFRSTRSDATKSMRYTLAAHAYSLYPDLLAALGADGIGSLEITPDRVASGTIPAPIVDARLLSAGKQGGSFGAAIPAVAFGDETLGAFWPLLANAQFRIGNPVQRRYNLGLRVLGDEVHVTARLLASDGTQKALVARTLPPEWHEQTSATDFFGQAPASGDVIEVVVLRENGRVPGGAIVYLAETDNTTADVDLMVARAPRMWLSEPMLVCSTGCTMIPR